MKIIKSCFLLSSAAYIQAASISEQLFLSCERSDGDRNHQASAHTEAMVNKSFLDAYFGNFLDGVVGAVSVKGKREPLPLPDEIRGLAVHENYEYPDPDDLRDINGSAVLYRGGEFGYIDTFAHLPLTNCFDPELYEKESFDIAVIGAPFDSGVSYRPGARFGPSGIRLGSRRLAPAYSVYNEKLNPYKNWAKIVDCGSPPVTPLDNRIAIDQIYRANRAAGKHSVTKKNKFNHPKIVTLGGDHTITLPAIKAAYENWGKISVIHFDSHLDTWNPYYFGGNVTDYQSLNHGTYLHWAHEKGLLSDTSIHAAIRGPYPGKKDVEHDISCGFDRILARDIDKIGADGIIKKIKQRVGDSPVYITVDVDSMDPSTAPASGTVEPGGWTSRELLTVLDGLDGINIIGGDVVEVSPPYDTAAEITSVVAAQVADSIISLIVLHGESETTDSE
ncbi:hypothetical protein VIN7_5240 [Saccharomyces cerevisiae x Saccharomyces kudriavzevii VIN7]|uniref:Agmatinase n=2 Tax=Saccharomyces TaxID=4930 RepID=H0GQE8_SACCK|nr:hypothetical protein VIN7_5240 [Saccharomyces cerevisiae x Saccharomyces kudriavzevii VIN7]CAI4378613.1 BLD_1a_G0025540.mRNA.1.CDS.1 [Saccharomyces cerevisiae]CAI6465791.1 AAB_G0000070.mRNA.1.CDS.1 [Saccharomyces cerevisiae]CAI7087003.1 BLD_1a_G0025540.mRNA.1.CDS.1 [Saccharomyces cerevisiae]